MQKIRNPLNKSLLKICVVTFSVLCIGLMIFNYFTYRSMLFQRYREYMKNILTNIACEIDVDDLAECIRTGEKSQAFLDLQAEMDQRKDHTDLHYLYIILPLNSAPSDNMRNVMEAMSREEYENSPDEMAELNSLTGTSYSAQEASKYLLAFRESGISYFENTTEWGRDYTALLPLVDSHGSRVAALCVDIDMSQIYEQMLSHSMQMIGITVAAGVMISMLFLLWAKRNVVRPIEKLEQTVTDYTANRLGSKNPDSLVIAMPNIQTGNEVESLAQKIVRMSEALRDTVKTMLRTKKQLAHMSIIATKDELTRVGNKAAYKEYVDKLEQQISTGDAEFSVVLADINRLKYVNDTFGHEKGDHYIRKCCSVLTESFRRSRVFRIGGDEFVVFLTGQDYENRKQLFLTAKQRCVREQYVPGVQPWEAVSLAMGLAVYSPDFDNDVQQVVTRADRKMYADKARIHKQMDAARENTDQQSAAQDNADVNRFSAD